MVRNILELKVSTLYLKMKRYNLDFKSQLSEDLTQNLRLIELKL